jgi:AcrR family transcriptional regulator
MSVVDLRTREEGSAEDRIVEATLRCVARWGVAKTTLDDVAREAGMSRATVYRLVPGGKENLMALVSTVELNRFFVALHEAVRGIDTLEDTIVTGVVTAARHLEHHGALKFMIEHEPEQILPPRAVVGRRRRARRRMDRSHRSVVLVRAVARLRPHRRRLGASSRSHLRNADSSPALNKGSRGACQ